MAAAKIVTTCKIKDVKLTAKGAAVNFKELKLTDDQVSILTGMVMGDETVEITLKATQQKMEFEDKKKKASGDGDNDS